MYIFDSRTKQPISLEQDEVRLYVCGPTVYDDAHLGHARSAVAFDLFVRVLKALKKKVIFARNITDIDDKIIQKIHQSGLSLQTLTQTYTNRYHDELALLQCLSPDIEPKATENITEMIALIEKLLNTGYAYQTPTGDIYFDTTKDTHYLSISHNRTDEALGRIAETADKHAPQDFVLWKATKTGEDIFFDAPFGRGRPGWHTECSAMIHAHLAYKNSDYQIDVHGGGSDLLFPHHENEAAQTRCAFNTELSHIWMHNGFVTIGGEKMSKSLGNSFFLKDALAQYDGEIIRYYLLGTHYRANFNFSLEDLEASKKRLDKLYRLKKRLVRLTQKHISSPRTQAVLHALEEDLNISKALAIVDETVQTYNDTLDKTPKDTAVKTDAAAFIADMGLLLGIGMKDATHYFQLGVNESQRATIEQKLEERTHAKKEKNFTRADEIRDELEALGISIMDTSEGTTWEKR